MYHGRDLAFSWSLSGPRTLWRKPVGEGFAGPVVAGGKLILFHRSGDQEIVECLNAANGWTIWSFSYPATYRDDFGFEEGPRATPCISDGRVYTFGAQGVLHCLDLQTGRQIWDLDTQEKFGVRKGFFGAACSPLIEQGRVLLNVGGTNGAGLVALDKETGRVIWTATDDEASYSSPTVATIGDRRHALFFTRDGLVDSDPETGRVRLRFGWRSRTRASVNAATPLVIGDLVFLSASYGTGAILLQIKGNRIEKLWSSDRVLSNHYATSVYRQGHLYGFHGRQEYGPSFRSVDLKSGKVQWGEARFGAGTVILIGDHLLILREDGELFLLAATPDKFTPLAQTKLMQPTVRAYPALAGGRLYARNQEELVCVDLKK